ncbi:MAG: rhomboid family intramembrane serine protease [Eubacteriales bacterium]|nr:rhomboid family intramembrane serine protease [Eubacteriales bacterium]
MKKRRPLIFLNSPVILLFTGICLLALLASNLTGGRSNDLLFSVYRSSLASPFTYLRFIGHVFGHVSREHFMGNIMMILVIGPLLEEKYGSANIAIVILVTALITGIIQFVFFPGVQLMGASGVVFAFILLSSFTSFRDGSIPLTFLLVACIYLGEEIYDGIFLRDNVSNLTHIVGGLIGAALGYLMNKKN